MARAKVSSLLPLVDQELLAGVLLSSVNNSVLSNILDVALYPPMTSTLLIELT